MRYSKFTIKNYKGIKNLDLDLAIHPDYKIYTLVGLNESGKTTILEAINDFENEVPLNDQYRLIPKYTAGGFSDPVIINASLLFSEEDKKKVIDYVNSLGKFTEIHVLDSLEFTRTYEFKNSIPTGKGGRTYTHFVQVRKTKNSKLVFLEATLGAQVWTFIKGTLFPEIIFYRDFLSKFPEKIYLEGENIKEKEYISIIEDVLVSINSGYKIETSLLERLKNPNDANRQALEAVENELGGKITEIVFKAWNLIQKVSKKEIVAKTGKDDDGKFFIKLYVKDGNQSYSISERSLGFRWFFTFLLYTEFRKERIKTSGEILFLLDEPASNLHQSAQKSLLGTFESIVKKSRLIYTTHSHHLINPLWLNSSYIIRNNGLRYDELNDDFTTTKTEIEAYKYKQFVSNYPTQTDYFKPILDVLDYQPGLLESVPNIVITEGKFDYFTFKYFRDIVLGKIDEKYVFYPGHSASNLDLPISLYLSWGRQFIALLDGDKKGIQEKNRYLKEYPAEDRVFTLEDISSDFKGLCTEGLFTKDEMLLISKEFNSGLKEFNKSAFNTGIQILLSEKRVPEYISETTKQNFHIITEFLNNKFS